MRDGVPGRHVAGAGLLDAVGVVPHTDADGLAAGAIALLAEHGRRSPTLVA